MDRFHAMKVYVAVAEERGFAAAARRLNLSPPAVTRAVAELEARLRVRLLTRTTRHVRVTGPGAQYLAEARRLLEEVEAMDEAIAGSHRALSGPLVVTAPALFGRLYVIPGVVEYLRRYPQTSINALLVDRVVNLVEEGVDAGVRIGELPDSSLNAAPAGHVRRVVCAAPAYLRKHGVPRRPQDLKAHSLIASSSVGSPAEWRFAEGRRAFGVRLQPRLVVSNNDSAVEAALRGFGLTRLLSYQAAAHVAAGKLELVLRAYEPGPLPIHLVYREGRQASARTRAFVDLMVQRLRADPALA
jgi:DNA-binding transcriptional LysR family regulator